MNSGPVITDSAAVERARHLLRPVAVPAPNPWNTLMAAAMAATAAVLMAGVVILGPGVRFEDPTVDEAVR